MNSDMNPSTGNQAQDPVSKPSYTAPKLVIIDVSGKTASDTGSDPIPGMDSTDPGS